MAFIIPLILLLLIIYFIYSNKNRKSLKEFPQPPANFLLGHSLEVKETTKILNTITKFTSNYGTTVRVIMGPPLVPVRVALITIDYEFVEFLLTSNKILTKTENYYYLVPWLGRGLLISDGDEWRKHRKIITPAFHFEILKQFVSTFESVGSIFIDKLKNFDNCSSVDLYPLVTLCTLDVICETAMGTKINAQNGQNLDYIRCVREMCKIVINRSINPIKIFYSGFKLTRDFQKQKKLLKILHGFTLDVINKKKIQIPDKNENGKKVAFLDLLLKFSEKGNLLNDEEIRAETDTFMFEGHDTTASAICFILFSLANHPEIQEKVLQEQKLLFGKEKNPVVTYQELQNMKYLEKAIKESLRLYPPVPVIGRYTSEDIEFKSCKIPKHTNIVISLYNIHRNPKHFPEPEKFDPERFEKLNSFLPYIYVPFSAGPRNCIGQKFAMLEMKSVVSKVIRHFELTPAVPWHDLVLSVETVLKSTNGVKVALRKRL